MFFNVSNLKRLPIKNIEKNNFFFFIIEHIVFEKKILKMYSFEQQIHSNCKKKILLKVIFLTFVIKYSSSNLRIVVSLQRLGHFVARCCERYTCVK